MTERAGVVVSQPLPVVEALVRDVPGWPALFAEVVDVSRLAHDRYLIELRRGRRTRTALVRVRWNPAEHRFGWRSVSGQPWSGELRLIALTGRRTAVELTVADRDRPTRRWARLLEAVRGQGRAPGVRGDLDGLCRRVAALPQPVRPTRLTPMPGARPVQDVLMVARITDRPAVSERAPRA